VHTGWELVGRLVGLSRGSMQRTRCIVQGMQRPRLLSPCAAPGAVHSGVPAWLLVLSMVERRARERPKSQTCGAAVTWRAQRERRSSDVACTA
jgi:hypothetical protein